MNKKFFSIVEKINRKLSQVKGEAYFSEAQFPWLSQIESACAEMQSELQELLAKDGIEIPTMAELSGGKSSVKHTNTWQALCLFLYGQRLCDDPQFLPKTHAILQKIPGMKTAFLSVLKPDTVIKPHRGPYNGVLRFHLGLAIPQGDCAIVVNGEQRGWREGKGLVFDDSYLHSAWNKTPETRVVLFVDFLRPLPIWYAWLNELIYKKLCAHEFQIKFRQKAAASVDAMSKA